MKTLYPVQVQLKVHITNGEASGSATYSHGLHRLPEEADMEKILTDVMQALPDGFRLMTRHESMMHFLRDERHYQGPNVALPVLAADERWHNPNTANTISFSADDDEEEADE